jgi:hypothetical protein
MSQPQGIRRPEVAAIYHTWISRAGKLSFTTFHEIFTLLLRYGTAGPSTERVRSRPYFLL